MTRFVANLSYASYADGKMTLPFTVSGTLENPKFNLTPRFPLRYTCNPRLTSNIHTDAGFSVHIAYPGPNE